MGTRSNPDSDRPVEPDGEVRLPDGQPSLDPSDQQVVLGLLRKPEGSDRPLHHALRPEGYFIFHQAHGT